MNSPIRQAFEKEARTFMDGREFTAADIEAIGARVGLTGGRAIYPTERLIQDRRKAGEIIKRRVGRSWLWREVEIGS